MSISGPSSNKENAIALATEKCVQYLAFYRGLAMQVDFGTVADSSKTKTSIEYNVIGGTADRKISEVSDEFEIVDIQWLGGRIGAVVFARLPEMKTIKSIDNILGSKVPNIKGRYVAVATSELSYANLDTNSLGGFADVSYWSSSEYSNYTYYAWGQDFNSGYQYSYYRYYNLRVRPVRAF